MEFPKDESDRLLGQKAVERGWITPGQLADAVAEQTKRAKSRPIGNILASKGYLSDERLIALLEELKGNPLAAETAQPGSFPYSFGKYTLLREIGRGGMGIVFEAKDTVLDRRVALKVVLPRNEADAAQTQEETDRFMREARLSANLSKHPNIVGVYDAGAVDGRCYLAMEFIEGQSQSKWRRTPGITIQDEVLVLRDVARGVHHAHLHGVIHRDLKPDNILLSAGNHPHVTDFGLAKHLDPQVTSSLTAQGRIMGTPHYMSPEQAEGLDTLDSRTDIYSLGVILYEALAGRPPFTGKTAVDVLLKVVREPAAPPSSLRPAGTVDARLEAICLRAIAKDPAKRQPTAEALAVELDAWQAAAPPSPPAPLVPAAPAPLPPPAAAVPAARPKRGIARPLAVAALLLVGAAVGVFFTAVPPGQRPLLLARVLAFVRPEGAPRSLKPGAPSSREAPESASTRGPEEPPYRGAADVVAQHPGPVDAGFLSAVAKLPPEEQVAVVSEKLKALNPSYSGKAKHRVELGKVVEWSTMTNAITDLSPLRALADLKFVELPAEWDTGTSRFNRSKLSDLSPLRGLALQRLKVPGTAVRDLSALRGMPLATLRCDWTDVSDLTPLGGMPLTWLDIASTPVTDLSPLAGLPLETLLCGGTKISDLSPLRDAPLKTIMLRNSKVTDYSPLRNCPLANLKFDYVADRDGAFVRSLKPPVEVNDLPLAEFVARYARPWEGIFDGKSLGGVLLQPKEAWALDKGTLTSSGNECVLLTKDDYEDGEFRIRFRSESVGFLSIAVRHSNEKGFSVLPDPAQINASRGKVHEVLFTCREDVITAVLDGQPIPLKFRNGPRRGPIQIHVTGGGHLVLVSIERR